MAAAWSYPIAHPPGTPAMVYDLFKNRWWALKLELRERWPKLDAEDLIAIDGDVAYLAQALQQHYQWDEARAWAEIDAYLSAEGMAGPLAAARQRLRPGAEVLREGLAELGNGVRDLASSARTRAQELIAEQSVLASDVAAGAASAVTDTTALWLARGQRLVRERPLMVVGLAALAGYLLLRRR